mmetsp:Transcript_11607/g.24311  ORF Transcript_11607/g.24311 Transcript_11607/m.24311 type:complete len:416 (+) Transcript_11607:226-1473(+)
MRVSQRVPLCTDNISRPRMMGANAEPSATTVLRIYGQFSLLLLELFEEVDGNVPCEAGQRVRRAGLHRKTPARLRPATAAAQAADASAHPSDRRRNGRPQGSRPRGAGGAAACQLAELAVGVGRLTVAIAIARRLPLHVQKRLNACEGAEGGVTVSVEGGVGLIADLLLQELAQQRVEGDDARGAPLLVLHHGGVQARRAQEGEHAVQRHGGGHPLEGQQRQRAQWDGVLRGEHDHVLDHQEARQVVGVPRRVHRHALEPRLQYGHHGLHVQDGVVRQAVHLGDGGGDGGHRLLRHVHGTVDHAQLVLAQHPLLPLQLQQRLELVAAEGDHVVGAEHVVQHEADGVRDGCDHRLQHAHEGCARRAHPQPVLRAHRLRHNLAEDEHHRDGDENCCQGFNYLVEAERKALHGEGVAQ